MYKLTEPHMHAQMQTRSTRNRHTKTLSVPPSGPFEFSACLLTCGRPTRALACLWPILRVRVHLGYDDVGPRRTTVSVGER